jgi:hypothetical protein
MDFNPLDLILHLDVYLDLLVTNYGPWIYAILFLVIFCETGLVVMPFLPGDRCCSSPAPWPRAAAWTRCCWRAC